MTYDPDRARAALAAFQTANRLQDFPWETASGVGEGTLRRFRNGDSKSLGAPTYSKLAVGASGLLGRPVTVAELRGEIALLRRVAVANFVGPGAEIVHLADKGAAIDQVEAPPGFNVDTGSAFIIRGDAGSPIFEAGDVLFVGPPRRDAANFIGKVAAVQVKGGPRLIRRILRGRRGRFDLMGVNPATAILTDQAIAEVAAIEWIHRAGA